MNHRNNLTGQSVDTRDHNDNAPPRYSAPSANFKEILASYANRYCGRCGGTGYIGRFKHVCTGRCFKCIPENVWEQAQGEFDLTCKVQIGGDEIEDIYPVVCGDNGGGLAYLCNGLWTTPNEPLLMNPPSRWPETGVLAQRADVQSTRRTS